MSRLRKIPHPWQGVPKTSAPAQGQCTLGVCRECTGVQTHYHTSNLASFQARLKLIYYTGRQSDPRTTLLLVSSNYTYMGNCCTARFAHTSTARPVALTAWRARLLGNGGCLSAVALAAPGTLGGIGRLLLGGSAWRGQPLGGTSRSAAAAAWSRRPLGAGSRLMPATAWYQPQLWRGCCFAAAQLLGARDLPGARSELDLSKQTAVWEMSRRNETRWSSD